jgi:hypothetical protein
MSVVTDKIGKSLGYGRGRKVSVERDGTDFVVAFQHEGHVIFRHHDLKELRSVSVASLDGKLWRKSRFH